MRDLPIAVISSDLSQKLREFGKCGHHPSADLRLPTDVKRCWDKLIDEWADSDLPIVVRKSSHVRGELIAAFERSRRLRLTRSVLFYAAGKRFIPRSAGVCAKGHSWSTHCASVRKPLRCAHLRYLRRAVLVRAFRPDGFAFFEVRRRSPRRESRPPGVAAIASAFRCAAPSRCNEPGGESAARSKSPPSSRLMRASRLRLNAAVTPSGSS